MSAFTVRPVTPASRMGLKGPDAATLLRQAGIAVPSAANRMLLCPTSPVGTASLRVLRLGNTEFVLEQDEGDDVISTVRTLSRSTELRAWPVLRADFSLLMGGDALHEQLSRICDFDFAQLAAEPALAVMTLLADISVTFALEPAAAGRQEHQLRLWADPGFATYLTQTLQSLSPDAPSHGVHA